MSLLGGWNEQDGARQHDWHCCGTLRRIVSVAGFAIGGPVKYSLLFHRFDNIQDLRESFFLDGVD